MAKSLKDFAQFLNKKNIVVVGGSPLLFDHPHDVDSHDVVIRINYGCFLGERGQQLAGKRTDMLAVSEYLSPPAYRAQKKVIRPSSLCNEIIWMSPHSVETAKKLIGEDIKDFPWYFYPLEDWNKLQNTLNARPTTGCMLIDMITRYVEFSELHICGFDFFRQNSWYMKAMDNFPHDGAAEEQFLENLCKTHKNVKLHLPETIKNMAHIEKKSHG